MLKPPDCHLGAQPQPQFVRRTGQQQQQLHRRVLHDKTTQASRFLRPIPGKSAVLWLSLTRAGRAAHILFLTAQGLPGRRRHVKEGPLARHRQDMRGRAGRPSGAECGQPTGTQFVRSGSCMYLLTRVSQCSS